MIAWMLYTIIVGFCAVIAASAAEWLLRARRRPIRFVWMGAALLSIGLSATAPLRRHPHSPGTTSQIDPASLALVQTSLHSVEQRVPASVVPYVLALWALATVVVALSFGVVYWRVRRARRGWPVVELLDQRVRIAPAIGPLVLGIVRPEIIVPRWILDRTREEQRVILAHESAHVQARDPILLTVVCALAALVPWNPGLWLILSRLRLAIEVDCDTRVLRGGISARSYSSLLVDVAERAMPLRLAATALADDSSHLHQRILAMHPRRTSHPLLRGLSVAILGLAALLAACEAKMPTAAQVDAMDARSAEGAARSFGVVRDSTLSWFVNGVPSSAVAAKQIIADSIASVEVHKVEGSSRIYIVTKSAASVGFAKTIDTARVLRRRADGGLDTLAVTLSQPKEQGAEPILFIDGVRSDAAGLKKIDRARIATVNVLKGGSAVSEYGPDAKNGVIVVRTKPAGAP
jgi:beta-lactamase regulating signal transducer with metallopeptidase domain